ncbi:hypothetical protein Dimus_006296, partial [Dionaea muscipula]
IAITYTLSCLSFISLSLKSHQPGLCKWMPFLVRVSLINLFLFFSLSSSLISFFISSTPSSRLLAIASSFIKEIKYYGEGENKDKEDRQHNSEAGDILEEEEGADQESGGAIDSLRCSSGTHHLLVHQQAL